MKNTIDHDENIIREHSKGTKNADELIAHLPCHTYHISTGMFFYLDNFKAVTEDGEYWYAGMIQGILSSRIVVPPSDTFLLLDSDPTTFLPPFSSFLS